MDIVAALQRIRALNQKLSDINRSITALETKPVSVSCVIATNGYGANEFDLPADQALELLKSARDLWQSELDKIQPVVDMADAALKGLLS